MIVLAGETSQWNRSAARAIARLDAAALQRASTATTVRLADGTTQVLDGPFAESKEQLGGYFLIDVPDLASALSWAARCPGASHGVVEVRALGAAPS